MNENELQATVMSSLERFLTSKQCKAAGIRGSSRPIGDLGLDSADGVDWACDLEDVGVFVPRNANPLVDDENHRARTVDQIVDYLFKLVSPKQESSE